MTSPSKETLPLPRRRTDPLAPLGITDANRLKVGRATLRLINHYPRWVHRRVESVKFLDDRSLRRHNSIDFTLPSDAGFIVKLPSGFVLVPVVDVTKSSLKDFDLVDEDGRALPMLTSEQNSEVALLCLRALIWPVQREQGMPDLPQEVYDELRLIARHPTRDARERHATLLEGVGEGAKQRRHALGNKQVDDLVQLFIERFLVLVPIKYVKGERRVIKFSYEESRRGRVNARSLLEQLGLVGKQMNFTGLPASQCEAFHFEVETPDDLVAVNAELVAFSESFSESEGRKRRVRATDRSRRVHLNIGNLPPGSQTRAWATFKLQRPGLVLGSLLVAVLTTALLWFMRLHLDDLAPPVASERHSGSLEAAGALLLVIPTLLIAFLVRPGEHALATSLMGFLRLALVVVGVCSLLAAASLAAGVEGTALRDEWLGFAIAASTATAFVLLHFMCPRRTWSRK